MPSELTRNALRRLDDPRKTAGDKIYRGDYNQKRIEERPRKNPSWNEAARGFTDRLGVVLKKNMGTWNIKG
jgi:hypothetical protein